jgi:hypothetical protein
MDDQMRYPRREQTDLGDACKAQYSDRQVNECYRIARLAEPKPMCMTSS